MKLYTFDKQTLDYKNVTKNWVLLTLTTFFVLVGSLTWILVKKLKQTEFVTEETKAIIISEFDKQNKFTAENLKAYILELNIRFPHIVYAQAKLETGNFKSKIFRENNNLFGMKEAKRRPTTNKGTENNHAVYLNWKESVVDYAMYSAAYLNGIKSESEYFDYLRQNYAQDTSYVLRLKEIIEKQKMK